MKRVETLSGKNLPRLAVAKPGWPSGVIDFAERKTAVETEMVERAFLLAGVDSEQADKVLADFTRVCDQTGLSGKKKPASG